MNDDVKYEIYLSQLRDSYARVVYTHKVHEKSADRLIARERIVRGMQIVLSAIVSTGLLVTIFGEVYWVVITTTLVSILLVFVNTFFKGRNLVLEAQEHKAAASKLWLVRERYMSIIADVVSRQISIEEIRLIRDKILKDQAAVYANSPRTNNAAYKKAQKALQKNEDLTTSDEEINMFLPSGLKKKP